MMFRILLTALYFMLVISVTLLFLVLNTVFGLQFRALTLVNFFESQVIFLFLFLSCIFVIFVVKLSFLRSLVYILFCLFYVAIIYAISWVLGKSFAWLVLLYLNVQLILAFFLFIFGVLFRVSRLDETFMALCVSSIMSSFFLWIFLFFLFVSSTITESFLTRKWEVMVLTFVLIETWWCFTGGIFGKVFQINMTLRFCVLRALSSLILSVLILLLFIVFIV